MQVVTIRVTEDMHKRLKRRAKRQGLTMNAFIVNCLWEILTSRLPDKTESED